MPDPAIVVTRRWPDVVETELRSRFPGIILSERDEPLGEAGLRTALQKADCLLSNVSDSLSADLLLADGVRTSFIGNYGVGYSNIDVAAATRADIVVTNTPDVLTNSTADLAVGLMLIAARRAGEGERHVRSGEWHGWRPTHMMGRDVWGKTLGILGMGRIGAAVARRGHFGFGMSVVWFDRFEGAQDPGVPGARRASSIDEVLQVADFVSLHMPGGGDNSHLIGAREFGIMKPDAVLVNTARGDVLDEGALVEALRGGVIAAAGLDVYENEPDVTEALRTLENVVLLPHLGSATLETRIAMGRLVVKNLTEFLEGREPPCRVC